MAGWDGYIDSIISTGEGHCDKVCIIGKDGSQWTTPNHANALKIAAEEVQGIVAGTRDISHFQTKGAVVDGVKYQFLRNDEDQYYFKKKEFGALTVYCSKQAIVLGHTREGSQQGKTNCAVGKTVEYLKSVDY